MSDAPRGYRVFHRTWWRSNPDWPEGREPGAGTKTTIARHVSTECGARDMCRVWNLNHDEGPLADRAEYTAE